MRTLALVNFTMLGLAGTGCMLDSQESAEGVETSSEALVSENGLNGVNGLSLNGLSGINGLSLNGLSGINGLSLNGLSGINGLSLNGLSGLNGLSLNGLSGLNGLSLNGLSGLNGLSLNGLSGLNGLSLNGLEAINGISSNGIGTNGLASTHGLRSLAGSRYALVASDRRADTSRLGASVGPAGQWLVKALHSDGLSVRSALSSDAGLAGGTGLMESSGGRLVASYLVKCALPADRSVTKYDGEGNLQTLQGSIGVAPEWENGACDATCQEWMSACLLAHVNLTGRHVSIWITAEHPAINLSKSDDFPLEEAAFFGNLFASSPEAYVCHGENAADHPIAGRVCDGSATCPYANPYSAGGGACESLRACRAARMESGETSGYASCTVGNRSFANVITTWKP